MNPSMRRILACIILMIFSVSSIFAEGSTDLYKIKKRNSDSLTWIEQDGLVFMSSNNLFSATFNCYGKKDVYPVLQIRLIDLETENTNYIKNLSDKAKKGDKEFNGTLKLRLSNGEYLTSTHSLFVDSRKEGFDFIGICDICTNLSWFRSSTTNIDSYSQKEIVNYVANRLKTYNITSLTADGYIFSVPSDFKSTILFSKMIPEIYNVCGFSAPVTTPKTTTPPASSYSNKTVTGNIEKVWTEYNCWQNGLKGMKIHTKFNVNNLRGKKGRICAYFYFASGVRLKPNMTQYSTTDNHVTVQSEFKPNYDNTTFNDFTLFIPYDALNMSAGSHKLKYNVELFEYTNGSRQFAKSTDQFFDFSK